ncbi:MAG TPA: DUF3040 domain-containing protein [Streptosporangiaceae bacterium]|nr:DUF3040 domain-containing protein [Streptosporangiaceae bacterium]
MPLSEHEQRQLEQIEQALYAEHPRFARAVRASDPRVHYRRRLIQAALGFLVGVGLLVAGVATKNPWIGAAGFVVMLACSMWALSSYRHMSGITSGRGLAGSRPGGRSAGRPGGRAGGRSAGRPGGRKAARQSRPAGASMMERLEERWRRRQERGDR